MVLWKGHKFQFSQSAQGSWFMAPKSPPQLDPCCLVHMEINYCDQRIFRHKNNIFKFLVISPSAAQHYWMLGTCDPKASHWLRSSCFGGHTMSLIAQLCWTNLVGQMGDTWTNCSHNYCIISHDQSIQTSISLHTLPPSCQAIHRSFVIDRSGYFWRSSFNA